MFQSGTSSAAMPASTEVPCSTDADDTQFKLAHRDEELWFEDGNIVIIAARIKAFRVYKGLLAQVSVVFRDMLELDPAPNETLYGCPLVHVPDSPVEMSPFLRAVFLSGGV